MRVEVICYIIDFGVYGDPAITLFVMLRQIMEAEGLWELRRHDRFLLSK